MLDIFNTRITLNLASGLWELKNDLTGEVYKVYDLTEVYDWASAVKQLRQDLLA